MKKIAYILLLFVTLFLNPLEKAQAQLISPCSDFEAGVMGGTLQNLSFVSGTRDSLELTIDTGKIETGSYEIMIYDKTPSEGGGMLAKSERFNVDATTTLTDAITISSEIAFIYNAVNGVGTGKDTKHVYLYRFHDMTGQFTGNLYCKLGEYTIENSTLTCSEPIRVYQNRTINGEEKQCYSYNNTGCIEVGSPVFIETDGIKNAAGQPYSGSAELRIDGLRVIDWIPAGPYTAIIDIVGGKTNWQTAGFINDGTARVSIPSGVGIGNLRIPLEGVCTQDTSFVIQPRCQDECIETPPSSGNEGAAAAFKLCEQILDSSLQKECQTCAGSSGQDGVWTAVGCIKRDPVSIAKRLIQVGLGMGGGVALIMTLAGGFILSTSQGDPQKANQAKEMITNSIIGLLFVIFSVVILQFIGVTILRIPGFGADTEQVN